MRKLAPISFLDVETYGFGGRNHTNSTFNKTGDIIRLAPPVLNITASYILSPYYGWEDYLDSNNEDNRAYLWNNNTYFMDYISTHGSCQQENTYKWGFSYLLLFIVTLLTTIWAIGMWSRFLAWLHR